MLMLAWRNLWRQRRRTLITLTSIAFGFGLAQLIFAWIVIDACLLRKGAKATAGVWEGARGLEWTVPSPAPHHTFSTPPVIDDSKLAHGDVTH